MINNHQNLQWQFDWAGTSLINKRILVSPDELDKPQRQLGTIVLPPDPVPVLNARPEQYQIDEQDYINVTANYTAVASDILNCDGTFTVYFPTAVGALDLSILINNIGTGTVTLSATTGTINGTTSISVGEDESVNYISDGANWIVFQLPQFQVPGSDQ